jgi:hypothetical protein
MSINTNHSQESLTPESGVLTIQSTGALKLPAGGLLDRPMVSAAGYIRFTSDDLSPEFHDGTNWQLLTSKEYVDSHLTTSNTAISTALSNLKLNDLADVTISGPSDGQVIAFDATLGQFKSQTQSLNVVTRMFMGTGTDLNFDIITSVNSVQNLVVTVNGIQQEPFYSYNLVDGHIVTFDEAPESGDRVQVKILKSTTSTDRARPRVTSVSYGVVGIYTTITIVATDITYGTGVKVGGQSFTRVDYPNSNTVQAMIETSKVNGPLWSYPQDLTLVDTSGNEFVFTNLINYGASKPYWTDSNSYIGTFSSGDTINYLLGVNNSTSISLNPAHAGESAITWLSISGLRIVGTAPQNSSPSRYEVTVTASNGSVDITKNYWLLVI